MRSGVYEEVCGGPPTKKVLAPSVAALWHTPHCDTGLGGDLHSKISLEELGKCIVVIRMFHLILPPTKIK